MASGARATLVSLLIVAVGLTLLPCDYVCAGGYVKNAGFEDGEGDIPSVWNVTGNATRVDSGPIYAGNWSARVTGDGDVFTQWIRVGNLTLPVTFQAWGWIYVSGNVTGVIGVDFWSAVNGTQLSPTTLLSTNDTRGIYVQKTATVQSPSCTTCARIRLLGVGWNEGAEVRFDEIGLYVPTGGFCFIATAAYGTETASELDLLRDFRDQVLLKNPLGSLFVQIYYKVSPPIAGLMGKNDLLRTVVREVLLDPAVSILKCTQALWRA